MGKMESSKAKISTAVCVASIDVGFDIESIFNQIEICDTILGIKYHNRIRGNIKRTGSFFNQASMKVYNNIHKKEMNMKIFANGGFQLSGIKTLEQAESSIKMFLNKIKNMNGKSIIDVVVRNGITYNKNEYDRLEHSDHTRFNSIKIYGKQDGHYKIIGERKGKDLIINGNKVELFRDYFIDIKHKDCIKKMYDKNGICVGKLTYSMKRKRKNLILNGCIMKRVNDFNDEIYDKYENLIGNRIIHFDKDISAVEDQVNNILLSYSCINDDISSILNDKDFRKRINLRFTNINCNFNMKLDGHLLNKKVVHSTLVNSYNILSDYDPMTKYQTINIKLYYDDNMNLIGHNNGNYTYKFTVLLFQNGTIIISGCTNKTQIISIKRLIIKIFSEHKDSFIIKKGNISLNKDENLTIWDIV